MEQLVSDFAERITAARERWREEAEERLDRDGMRDADLGDLLQSEPEEPRAETAVPASWKSPAGVLRAQPKPKARFKSLIPALNKASRAGFPTGALVVLQGGPDAGKTGLGLQEAVRAALEEEAAVVIFTPDQGREATAVRIGALLGLDAQKLEERDEAELKCFAELLRDRDIFLPDDCDEETTVEAVIAAAEKIRPDLPHVLFLDSLQEARPSEQADDLAERERVIANVRACQKATKSTTVPWLVIATSQTTKASAASDPRNRQPAILAGAESAKIAFAAQLVVHLDGDPAQGPQFGRGRVVKNKLGGPKPTFGLQLDPKSTKLSESDVAEANRQRDESEAREREKALSKLQDEALALLLKHNPLNVTALHGRIGGRKGDLLAALNGLEAQGAAIWREGPRNSRVWEAVRRG